MRSILPIDVTVFIVESGEPSFKDALACIEKQTVSTKVKIISNTTPMWRAFQRMIDECDTRYYIQVDADMLLKPKAVATLIESFSRCDAKICMYVGWLYDLDMKRNILGVKIYDKNIFKHFPYRESLSCEVFQLDGLKRFGYSICVENLKNAKDEAESLGKHAPSQNPYFAFRRWERNMIKYRQLGYDYLAEYPKVLLERFKSDPQNEIALAQFIGCVSGLTCEIDVLREIDASKPNENYERLKKLLGF